ncbi:Dabb family protein [Nocardia sp. 348MFTsu5.1]|uniref:Dabb family protein n=1 Tax=Nocardia sp. 348MFTsu5.1 TaxID=1172185 RepID=UPI0004902660|nr:Dabb family protein [Nocardia sp. 348MFTsu5.1]
MYKVTSLLHFAEGIDEGALRPIMARLREFAASSGAVRSLIEPTLPGVRNGGDLLVHLQFEKPDSWQVVRAAFNAVVDAPEVEHIDEVEYFSGESGTRSANSAKVYRTLLLRVEDDVSHQVIRQFEDETLRMPGFIDSITSWQLSRVVSARGASQYTHVWEQEFTDLDGLMGPYLAHPVHWAYIDKWFDPECPEVIIRDRVCHSFCRLDSSVIERLVPEMTA